MLEVNSRTPPASPKEPELGLDANELDAGVEYVLYGLDFSEPAVLLGRGRNLCLAWIVFPF